MPINSESLNRKLYDLVSTRGYDPKPLDVEGKVTPVPEEAAVIKFDFIKDGENYGKVWASIDGTKTLQLYYGDSVSGSPDDPTKNVGYDDTWTGLLKHLKNWSQRRQLGFELRNENHLVSDMARRKHTENLGESTLLSDNKPKLSGLSVRDLDMLSESAGNDYYEFDKNLSKNLNIPKHKGISSNTLNLYAVYYKQKINESQDKNLSTSEEQLFKKFNNRVKSTVESVKVGDSVSVLSLSTLAVPNDKIFARLQGFLSPKEVKSISRTNNIDYLHFVDGTKFPDTDNDDPIYLTQSWIMTKLFDSYDSASKAFTIYALIGDELSDSIQFNIDVDTKKENLNEKKVSEIGFSNALGKLSIPDAEIIDNSTVVGTIGSRKVSLFKQGNNKIYFFTNNDKSKLDALLYLMDDNLLGMKNFSENSGLIYNLFQYLLNIEGQKLTIKSIDKLTPDGINWIIKQIKNPQSFNIKDQNGEKIDPKKLFQEWEKARKTHNPGPTGIVIGEGRNSIQLKENENRLMPMDIFGATLKLKKDMGSITSIPILFTENKNMNEIGSADSLDDGGYSTDNLLKIGKVIGNIEGNDVMMASEGSEKIYFLVVDGKITSFLGFKNGKLKNIKNFTQTAGVVRALIGFLVHKNGKKITISSTESLTSDGIKWLTHLIKSPRGLKISDQQGNQVDATMLKKEWTKAKETGEPGPTGVVIGENIVFGDMLRENEISRQTKSLLMPVNFYNTQGHQQKENDMKQVNEGYYPMGKLGSYSDAVPTTKIILQHTRKIEEGEQRYRNIAKIFVENMNGERFLIPTTKPGIARVYARHISEGGTPYDERGKHITSLVEEYKQMAGFVRATKNKQFNESAQELINEGVNHYQSLRETLHKMCGRRGYTAYFESWTPTLIEDGEEQPNLNELFVQETLDPRIESVMPILSRLHKKAPEVVETMELANWANEILENALEMPKKIDESIIRTNKKITNIIENGCPPLPSSEVFFNRSSHVNEWNTFKKQVIEYQMKYDDGSDNGKLKMRKLPKFISESYHMESDQGLGEIKELIQTAFKNAVPVKDLVPGKKYDVAVVFLDKLSKILEVNLHHNQTIKDVKFSDTLNDYVVSTKEGLEGASIMDQVEDVETLFFEKTGGLGNIETYLRMKIEPNLNDWELSIVSDEPKKKIDESHDIPLPVRSLYTQTYAKYAKTAGQAKGAKQMAYAQVEKKYGKDMADKLKAYHDQNSKLDEMDVAEGSDISGLLAASNLNKSFIITAELAEGGTKKFRVKAQSERVAKEKFMKHHSMAKIVGIKEETFESTQFTPNDFKTNSYESMADYRKWMRSPKTNNRGMTRHIVDSYESIVSESISENDNAIVKKKKQ